MLIVCLFSVVQGAKAASGRDLNTDASLKESDVLPEKLRLIWVCCAHAAVTAAVLAAPSAGSQALPRSILQESHWRHTHPHVGQLNQIITSVTPALLQQFSMYEHSQNVSLECH